MSSEGSRSLAARAKLSAFVSLLLLFAVTSVDAATVEPLVAIEAGAIVACGLVAREDESDSAMHVAFRAVKDGDSTAFEIAAGRKSGDIEKPARQVELVTGDHATSRTFTPVENGRARARMAGFEGSSFVQSLFVSGGRFEIVDSDGKTVLIELPSPMPHSVRQSYLNCAGDLFRPEDE